MKSILNYFFTLLAGMLIFAGLPMLGWGLGSLPDFFSNPARISYMIVIAFLQIFSLIYNPQTGRYKENRKSGVTQHKLDLILIQIFSLSTVILAPFTDARAILPLGGGETIRYVGVVLVIPGFVLMQMAEKYLDRQFSTVVTLQEGHQLIQAGPYRYLRHPRYFGILIFFLGITFAFKSLPGVMIVLALLAVLIWRVSVEDNLMRQEFGAEWEAYRKKSWRIIPFIF